MDYNNVLHSPPPPAPPNITWHRGWSDGEALSRVAQALFYKEAYCKVLGGGVINTWLKSNRAMDWISNPEHTDLDDDSYGCSILFIYYLYSQLGKGMDSIIRNAGSTLEATYHSLTGNSGGFQVLTQLLSKYFPIAQFYPPLPYDNPFPLPDGVNFNQRTIGMSFYQVPGCQVPSCQVASFGTARLAACPNYSPVKSYKWTLYNVPEKLQCIAQLSGFGQPTSNWRINGSQQLTLPSGDLSIPSTVQVDDPNNPGQRMSSKENVQLSYFANIVYGCDGVTAELDISNTGYPGHIILTIEADVSEKYASTDVTSDLAIGSIDTQELTYEDQYYKDFLACTLELRDRVKAVGVDLVDIA